MDAEKVIEKLNDMKIRYEELKKVRRLEAKDEYYKMTEVLERIIDRVYPEKDAKNLKYKLHQHLWIAVKQTEAKDQEDFCDDIDLKLRIIDTILEEHELFGFNDFKPIKQKVETEAGVKVGIFSLNRKKTTEK